MDVDLLYTADGHLREGDSALAQVRPEGRKGYGVVAVGGREWEIVNRGDGWRFALEDHDGTVACSFEPFHLLRGGRIVRGGDAMALRGRIGRPRAWQFVVEDGSRLSADLRTNGPPSTERIGSRRIVLSGVGRSEVQLRGSLSASAAASAPMILAFGCWILIQWESVPAGGAHSY